MSQLSSSTLPARASASTSGSVSNSSSLAPSYVLAAECASPEKLVIRWRSGRARQGPAGGGCACDWRERLEAGVRREARRTQASSPTVDTRFGRRRASSSTHLVERDPDGADLLALHMPVGGVVVPGRGRRCARLLDKELVVEDVGRRRAHRLGGERWRVQRNWSSWKRPGVPCAVACSSQSGPGSLRLRSAAARSVSTHAGGRSPRSTAAPSSASEARRGAVSAA
eukprot:scaffold68598_cov28-Tisochrysis_lutea.AAC.1